MNIDSALLAQLSAADREAIVLAAARASRVVVPPDVFERTYKAVARPVSVAYVDDGQFGKVDSDPLLAFGLPFTFDKRAPERKVFLFAGPVEVVAEYSITG